jgi:nitronate monooxygenase
LVIFLFASIKEGAVSSNRREFLVQAVSIAAGFHAIEAGAQQQEAEIPTPRARALMAAFGLKYPIFQAGIGTVARPELAIAVSAAGGMGAVGMSGATAERAEAFVNQVRSGTSRPFAVNYVLHHYDSSSLPAALDAGAPIIQFAWGIPSDEHVAMIRSRGARFGVQVGSGRGARRAMDLGADYLICQGVEAGGHVQATAPLADALPNVLEQAGVVPVLAAGGIGDGQAIRRALHSGASGVLMGTRFVATREAFAHEAYKQALIGSKAADTVLTVCFQDGWPNAPHRVLRNRTWTTWEAAGCPPADQRPGEGDVVATDSSGRHVRRYAITLPRPDLTGQLDELAMYAGESVDAIRDIPSAGELLERLWHEATG